MFKKRAAIGGDQEGSFENSLATLAYTYISDKAPGLIDYMIGFQLVDRNNDNTKAVGIFGFKISNQWLYVPVFFLNGDLKGHELLYLKNQDMFVPLKENWINYLIQKKPNILGEGTDETYSDLGMRSPNYESLAYPPFAGKTAGYRPPHIKEWARPAFPKIAQWITESPKQRYKGLDDRLNLENFLRDCGPAGIKLALDVSNRFPDLKNELSKAIANLKPYLSEVRAKVSSAATSPVLTRKPGLLKKASEEKSLEILVYGNCETSNLTESQKSKLLKQGYLVIDKRAEEDTSVAYKTQVRCTVRNPESTDYCEVLVAEGEFEKLLVIYHPYSSKGRSRMVTVVKPNENFVNAHVSKVFVNNKYNDISADKPFERWYDDLSGTSKSNLSKDTYYVIVGKTGSGTAPFIVREKIDNNTYAVSWSDYTDIGYHGAGEFSRNLGCCCGDSFNDNEPLIYFNERKGTSFKAINNKLYVPDECKIIKICAVASRLANKVIKPGTLTDIEQNILYKTAELKIYHDNSEVIINGKRFQKLAGFFHLIRNHGFREKDASYMMKEAEIRPNGGSRFLVKYALPSSAGMGPGSEVNFEDPTYTTDPLTDKVPAQYPETDYQVLTGLSSQNTDPSLYDPMDVDEPSAQIAQQAAETGQKEVFDTAMIGSMLKAVREDSIIDKYLGDLMTALDRLGRILFLLYWHGEDFEDRYGKQDMPELEDTARNAFEVLGDLALFLKQKTVDPMIGGVDVSEPSIMEAARN